MKVDMRSIYRFEPIDHAGDLVADLAQALERA